MANWGATTVVSVPARMDVEHDQKSWCAINIHTTIALSVQGRFGAMLPMCRSKSEQSGSQIPIGSRSLVLFSSGAEEAGGVATLHCQSKTLGRWVGGSSIIGVTSRLYGISPMNGHALPSML